MGYVSRGPLGFVELFEGGVPRSPSHWRSPRIGAVVAMRCVVIVAAATAVAAASPVAATAAPLLVDITLGARFAHTTPPAYASFNLDYHYDGAVAHTPCATLRRRFTPLTPRL